MNNISTVEAIGRRFSELTAGFNVPGYYKTFHTKPQHDGSPHIEKEGKEFCFVVTERGQELRRIRTEDPCEILYMLMEGFTSYVATQYELQNRIEGRDGREVWFPYQERLLYKMKPEWGIRTQRKHFQVLLNHPLRNEPFEVNQAS